MFITVGTNTQFRPAAWTVGHCSRCDALEALQVGDVVRVTDVSGFSVSRDNVGTAALCDWCGHPAVPAPNAEYVEIDGWGHADGLKRLFEICTPDLLAELPNKNEPEAMRKLLKRIARLTSMKGVDIGRGAYVGGFCGAVVGFVGGAILAPLMGFEAFEGKVLGVPAAGVLGCVVGSMIEGVVRGRRVAAELVEAAFRKYRLDPEMLKEAARRHPARVRHASSLVRANAAG